MAKKRNKNKKSVKTTKKQAKLKKDNNSDIKMNKLVKDERAHKVLGIFCLLLSAFLAIAFISYLFTWKADQGLVHRYVAGILLMKNLSLNNLLGRRSEERRVGNECRRRERDEDGIRYGHVTEFRRVLFRS